MKIGYKVLYGKYMTDLYGTGKRFEIDKEYNSDSRLIMHLQDFVYFDNIRDCMSEYRLTTSRVFECELDGDFFTHIGVKRYTNKIKLVRELSEIEIEQYISDNLESLSNDKNSNVRCEMARRGYNLDKYLLDPNWTVRVEVAHRRYCLNVLLYDEDPNVRCAVAFEQYGLDILINDEESIVRYTVALMGYNLDKLINDNDIMVRDTAIKQRNILQQI